MKTLAYLKTLDELAVKALALTSKIEEKDDIILDAHKFREQFFLARGKIINEAFTVIDNNISSKKGRVSTKANWCKKVKLTINHGYAISKIARAPNAPESYKIWNKKNSERNTRNRRRNKIAINGNTFPGAFAIMVQSLDQQTPAEFMAFPSVHEADIMSLIEFLKEAVE